MLNIKEMLESPSSDGEEESKSKGDTNMCDGDSNKASDGDNKTGDGDNLAASPTVSPGYISLQHMKPN